MTKTILLICSFLLNASLVTYFVVTHGKSDASTPVTTVARASAPATTPEVKPNTAKATTDTTKPSPEAQAWSRIYSTDLPTMVANLRAAGVDPKLIRVIIGSLVDEQFNEKRKALMSPRTNTPFWKNAPRAEAMLANFSKLNALYREQTNLINSLVGKPSESEFEFLAGIRQQQYGNLSSDKVQALDLIMSDYNEMKSQVNNGMSRGGGVTFKEDREKLAMLEREKENDLAALLTPDELAEYRIRTSPSASRIRNDYGDIVQSEQEFKALYALQKAFDDKYQSQGFGMSRASPAEMEERMNAEKALKEQIKTLLGETRYQESQMTKSSSYQAADTITQRLNLPKQNAIEVHKLSEASQQQIRSIMTDKNLSVPERVEKLKAYASDVNNKLGLWLTPTGVEAYRDSFGGSWVKSLETTHKSLERMPVPKPPSTTKPGG